MIRKTKITSCYYCGCEIGEYMKKILDKSPAKWMPPLITCTRNSRHQLILYGQAMLGFSSSHFIQFINLHNYFAVNHGRTCLYSTLHIMSCNTGLFIWKFSTHTEAHSANLTRVTAHQNELHWVNEQDKLKSFGEKKQYIKSNKKISHINHGSLVNLQRSHLLSFCLSIFLVSVFFASMWQTAKAVEPSVCAVKFHLHKLLLHLLTSNGCDLPLPHISD